MVLFGTHPVVVKPVNDSLNADVKLVRELFDRELVRIWVTDICGFQRLLLLFAEKQSWLLLTSRLVVRRSVTARLSSSSCKEVAKIVHTFLSTQPFNQTKDYISSTYIDQQYSRMLL